jgi:protein-S-isoprenylcysteine O-methyltransferase Ste14
MARVRAALGSLVFLFVAPGVVTVLVPYWLTGFESNDPPTVLVVIGALLIVAGAGVLLHAFARFVLEGIGTPAPVAPTEQLVVGGAYRWVRNPMYLAVAAMIGGQALIFASWPTFVWLLVFAAAVWSFVTFYEEPTLRDTYGERYDAYRAAVPGWWPRVTPWRG